MNNHALYFVAECLGQQTLNLKNNDINVCEITML